MSDADVVGRPWRFYIQDMIDFGEKVLAYTEGLDQVAFNADTLTYDATLRNLQLIGEAATHIPDEVRQTHSEIPWHAMIGIRNRLAHSYLAISDSIIWGVIQEAAPELLPALRNVLRTGEEGT